MPLEKELEAKLTMEDASSPRSLSPSPNALSFDNYFAEFHMSFAEGRLVETADALFRLRHIVNTSKVEGNDQYQVQKEMLESCEIKASSLSDQALTKLKAAIQADQENTCYETFFLLHQLGSCRKATISMTGYLRSKFALRARAALEQSKFQRNSGNVNEFGYIDRQPHIQILDSVIQDASNLFMNISNRTIDRSTLKLIFPPLHELCLTHALQIIQTFCEDARLSSWERRAIEQAKSQGKYSQQVESDESVQMVDLLLGEMAYILQICSSYEKFYLSFDSIEKPNEKPEQEFTNKIQELNGVYILLERFYIFQTIHKAIALVEPQEVEPGIYISSTVEDIPFILEKALERALRSMNYQTAVSIVIAMFDALDSKFIPSIINLPNTDSIVLPGLTLPSEEGAQGSPTSHRRLAPRSTQKEEESSFTNALLLAMDEDLTRPVQDEAKLILTLNSTCSTIEYLSKLQTMIVEVSSSSFPDQRSMLECVPKSIAELMEDFESLLSSGLQALLDEGIGADCARLVQIWLGRHENYVLSQEEYESAELHGHAVDEFLDELKKHPVLKRCRRTMGSKTLENFIQQLSVPLVQAIEQCLVEKVFNDWGAMFLEREMHRLSKGIGSLMAEGSVGAQFSRLNQIVLLIGLTNPKDAIEYSSVKEYLSSEEIAQYLSLRKGFRRDSIAYTVKNMAVNGSN